MNLAAHNTTGFGGQLLLQTARRDALRTTITEAMWYFADAEFTFRRLYDDQGFAALVRRMEEESGAFAGTSRTVGLEVRDGVFRVPSELVGHNLGGLRQGYVQVEGDLDTTGRHDHFLLNAYLTAYAGGIGVVGTTLAERLEPETSETDRMVNEAGRRFGLSISDEGMGFSGGLDVARFVYRRVCNETQCDARFRGINWKGVPVKQQ